MTMEQFALLGMLAKEGASFNPRDAVELDVGTVVYEGGRQLYKTLDEFNQQCFNYDSRDMQYGGETFQRFAYDYRVYNLYVYYHENELLFFVVDGNVGGYAVVNEDV